MIKFFSVLLAFMLSAPGLAETLTSCPTGTTRVFMLLPLDHDLDKVNDTMHVIGKTNDSGYATTTSGDPDNTCYKVYTSYWTSSTDSNYNFTGLGQNFLILDQTNQKGGRIPYEIVVPGTRLNPGKRVKQLQWYDGTDGTISCTHMDTDRVRVAGCVE